MRFVKRNVDWSVQRSPTYRADFIAANPGFHGKLYMCPYCGRIMTKKTMQVDHIVAVDLARNSRLARKLMPKEGVNDIKNLTAACRTCNAKKSNKGGLWILRGKYGAKLQAAVWVALIAAILVFSVLAVSGVVTPALMRSWMADTADFLAWLIGYIVAASFSFCF